MPLPKLPNSEFLRRFQVIPWGWLTAVWMLHICLGFLLATTPSWYLPVGLCTAVYGIWAKAKWSFIFTTIWWLVFLEALGEFLVGVVILHYTQPLTWPRPRGGFMSFDFEPFLVSLGILAVVKFLMVLFVPVSRLISTKVSKIARSKWRKAFNWGLPFLVALLTSAVAAWHWHLLEELTLGSVFSLSAITQLSFAAVAITVLALVSIVALILLIAVFVVPVGRAGSKLKEFSQATQLQTFTILSWTAGLGLWLGWLVGSKPQ